MPFGVIDVTGLQQGGVAGILPYTPVSYPINLASDNDATKPPRRIAFSAYNTIGVSRSPFTLQTQIQEYSGQLWLAEITLPPMEREFAEIWISWLLQLSGSKGTFYLGDPLGKTPRGSAAGSPQVNGAGQTGQVIQSKGWAASITGILKAGDYLQIGTRLHKVLRDTNSDGSGLATIDIWPRLRESPPDNATIVLSNTRGLFRLQNNTVPLFGSDETMTYDVSFSAIEAI